MPSLGTSPFFFKLCRNSVFLVANQFQVLLLLGLIPLEVPQFVREFLNGFDFVMFSLSTSLNPFTALVAEGEYEVTKEEFVNAGFTSKLFIV